MCTVRHMRLCVCVFCFVILEKMEASSKAYADALVQKALLSERVKTRALFGKWLSDVADSLRSPIAAVNSTATRAIEQLEVLKAHVGTNVQHQNSTVHNNTDRPNDSEPPTGVNITRSTLVDRIDALERMCSTLNLRLSECDAHSRARSGGNVSLATNAVGTSIAFPIRSATLHVTSCICNQHHIQEDASLLLALSTLTPRRSLTQFPIMTSLGPLLPSSTTSSLQVVPLVARNLVVTRIDPNHRDGGAHTSFVASVESDIGHLPLPSASRLSASLTTSRSVPSLDHGKASDISVRPTPNRSRESSNTKETEKRLTHVTPIDNVSCRESERKSVPSLAVSSILSSMFNNTISPTDVASPFCLLERRTTSTIQSPKSLAGRRNNPSSLQNGLVAPNIITIMETRECRTVVGNDETLSNSRPHAQTQLLGLKSQSSNVVSPSISSCATNTNHHEPNLDHHDLDRNHHEPNWDHHDSDRARSYQKHCHSCDLSCALSPSQSSHSLSRSKFSATSPSDIVSVRSKTSDVVVTQHPPSPTFLQTPRVTTSISKATTSITQKTVATRPVKGGDTRRDVIDCDRDGDGGGDNNKCVEEDADDADAKDTGIRDYGDDEWFADQKNKKTTALRGVIPPVIKTARNVYRKATMSSRTTPKRKKRTTSM
jgi:hypothetical protein